MNEWTSEGRKKGLSRKHPQPTSLKGPCSPPRSGDHDGFGGAGGPHEQLPLPEWRASLPEASPPQTSRQVELGVWPRTLLLSSGLCTGQLGRPAQHTQQRRQAGSLVTHSTQGKTEAREAGLGSLGSELQAGARATKATTTALGPERREAPAHPPLQVGRAQPAGIYVRSVGLRLRLDN